MRNVIACLAVGLCITTPTAANAETFRDFAPFVYDTDTPEVLLLDGEIDARSPLTLNWALRRYPAIRTLALLSPGGSVYNALNMAYGVRSAGLKTTIPAGSRCYSACALMFFAGIERTADGELGVHQLVASNAASGQFAAGDIAKVLTEFAISNDVLVKLLQTPSDKMYVFSPTELTELGLVTSGQVVDGPPPEVPPSVDATSIEQRNLQVLDSLMADLSATPNASSQTPGQGAVAEAPNATRGIVPGSVHTSDSSLLLEASDNADAGAVPFAGMVEWTSGLDENSQPTVEATASIPARKMSFRLVIRKNADATLPASLLLDLDFVLDSGFSGGGISRVAGILMKNAKLVQGVPLIGASANVKGNTFIFALSNSSSDIALNDDLLKTRKWMDFAVIYSTGKQAILTLKKSLDAEKLFDYAFAAWGSAKHN